MLEIVSWGLFGLWIVLTYVSSASTGLPDRRGSVAGELHLFTAEQEEEACCMMGGHLGDATDKNWNISIVPERLWAALRDIQKDVDTLLGRATE